MGQGSFFLQAHHHPSESNPFTIVLALAPAFDFYGHVRQVLDYVRKVRKRLESWNFHPSNDLGC